jgi:hypothetical protein
VMTESRRDRATAIAAGAYPRAEIVVQKVG